MLSERAKSQLKFHAVALVAAGVLDYLFEFRLYLGLVISFAGVFLAPRLGSWYASMPRRGKLAACAAVMLATAALVGAYLRFFSALSSPPPHPAYWFALAFILSFPLILFGMAFSEARRVARSAV